MKTTQINYEFPWYIWLSWIAFFTLPIFTFLRIPVFRQPLLFFRFIGNVVITYIASYKLYIGASFLLSATLYIANTFSSLIVFVGFLLGTVAYSYLIGVLATYMQVRWRNEHLPLKKSVSDKDVTVMMNNWTSNANDPELTKNRPTFEEAQTRSWISEEVERANEAERANTKRKKTYKVYDEEFAVIYIIEEEEEENVDNLNKKMSDEDLVKFWDKWNSWDE